MSEATHPEPSPAAKFEAAMRKILSVSKPEILRREAEHRDRQQAKHGKTHK
jgi:hypothetical protein